jgi:DNA-binding CsgD family transcriptional regulator
MSAVARDHPLPGDLRAAGTHLHLVQTEPGARPSPLLVARFEDAAPDGSSWVFVGFRVSEPPAGPGDDGGLSREPILEVLQGLAGAAATRWPDATTTLREPLSYSELRVLRYLPTTLSGPEIAAELTLSLNTIKTHMRHIYAKLDVHNRREAVERSRTLGLLAAAAVLR